jgi:HEAT repeat protein
LGFAISSDPLLRPVFWTGIGILVLALVMLITVLVLRVALLFRRSREQRFIEAWQPLLMQSIDGMSSSLPKMAGADRITFLRIWNHLQESVRGDATANLNRLLVACGLEDYVARLLDSRSVRKQLLGVSTLGHLRRPGMEERLRELAGEPHPPLSLAAGRAALQIDPGRNLEWFISKFVEREDWPLAKAASILSAQGVDAVTAPLIEAIETLADVPDTGGKLARLLQLLEIAHASRAAPVVRRILKESSDERTIAAALRALQDPRDLPVVRELACHPEWIVRVQAAQVLGRIGEAEDRKLLARMLSDSHWWVRYRAAQALVALPSVAPGELEKIRVVLPDRFAADMLRQAMAEGRA